MASRRHEPLTYGSLGRAWYNSAKLRWEFQRSPQTEPHLHPVTPTRVMTGPVLPPIDTDNGFYYPERKQKFKELLKDAPELGPLHSTIFNLTYMSEAIERIPADFDPNISDLLATGWGDRGVDRKGRPKDMTHERRRERQSLKPFLAHPGGRSGESLLITGLHTSQETNGTAATMKSPVPCLDLESEAEWTGMAVTPIQQICTSTSTDRSPCYVGAGRPSGTSIFRPWWEEQNFTNGHGVRWKAGFLFEIPASYTGGAEHIDVAFSPWKEGQFAILDARGHWHLFKVAIASGKYHYRSESSSAPRPGFEDSASRLNLSIRCDGHWGRLVFAAQPQLLVVCGRRDWGIFDTSAPARRITFPDIGLLGEEDIILDVKRDPSSLQLVFILTSSQLCWIRLAEEPDVAETATDVSPKLIMSWHHQWDCTSFVVRLVLSPAGVLEKATGENIGQSEGTYALAMIYGRGTGLLEVYTACSNDDRSLGTSVVDPYLIHLDAHDRKSADSRASAIGFLLDEIDIPPSVAPSNSDGSGRDTTACYLQLLELDARLGISQTILSSSTSQLPLHTLSLSPARPQQGLKQTDLTLQEEMLNCAGQYGKPDRNFSRSDIRSLGERLFKEGLKDFTGQLNETKISQKLNAIRNDPDPGHGVRLLSDIISSRFDIHDPDAVSDVLQHCLEEMVQQDGAELVVASVLIPGMRNLITTEPSERQIVSFSQLYDYMYRTWIAPLPKTIANLTKVALDKQVRQIALEVFLSSVSLGPSDTIADPPNMPDTSISSSQRKGKFTVSTSQPLSQEDVSGYSPSASLGRLTLVPPSTRDPTDVLARITDEWIVGADPTEYEWRRVRGIEGGALPPQQSLMGVAESSSQAKGETDILGTQSTVSMSQATQPSQSQSQSQSHTTEWREGKSKKRKRRKGF